MSNISTFCRICEARCGIDVTVTDGRVTRIAPDKLNPYTWRDFCPNPHGLVYGEPACGDLHEAIATPDGAVRLAPNAFVAEVRRLLVAPPSGPTCEHPFVLSNRRRKASMKPWLNDLPSARKVGDSNVLEIHADDAGDLSLTTGDAASVASPVACIELDVVVTERPQRGVPITEHGWGDGLGANRNALTRDTSIDELSATPAFSTTYVRVAKLPRGHE